MIAFNSIAQIKPYIVILFIKFYSIHVNNNLARSRDADFTRYLARV